ncbi:DUF6624 domain-containing protein [Streptomyces sp. NPDC002521]
MPVAHPTASTFVFARIGTDLRMGVITHPRLGDEMAPGGHCYTGEHPAGAALRELREETGHQGRLLSPPDRRVLPESYPHPLNAEHPQAEPEAWWTVRIPVSADSQHPERHTHVDHIFVAVVERPYGPAAQGEHPFRWITPEDLSTLQTPDDTRILASHLFQELPALLEGTGGLRRDEALRQELLYRQKADQEARAIPLTHMNEEDGAKLLSVDDDNTAWLDGVLSERGWPGWSTVGRDGAAAAWLLAQHADRHPQVQARCVDLLAAAVLHGDAEPSHLAYLEDRLAVARQQPQWFGTQFRAGVDGGWEPFPLQDADGVDVRRALIGLEPLAEYAQTIADINRSPQ